MCYSRKNIHTGNSSGGGRVLKTQKCKAMYEASMELPHGRGVIKQIPSVVRVWIFLELINKGIDRKLLATLLAIHTCDKELSTELLEWSCSLSFSWSWFLRSWNKQKGQYHTKTLKQTTLTYEAGTETFDALSTRKQQDHVLPCLFYPVF